MNEFKPFNKIGRLYRDCVITEKLDGTNGLVYIPDDLSGVFAGSKNRWATPENDNYGFAAWVRDNENQLIHLGPGYHYGEWWGGGIQRGYGLAKTDKRFSLFNVRRWCACDATPELLSNSNPTIKEYQEKVPPCCSVVPTLYKGPWGEKHIQDCLTTLRTEGSKAVPGFKTPEGIVIFHNANSVLFKVTLEKDQQPKGE